MIRLIIIIIVAVPLIAFLTAVLWMTEKQLEDESRMADKYGGK